MLEKTFGLHKSNIVWTRNDTDDFVAYETRIKEDAYRIFSPGGSEHCWWVSKMTDEGFLSLGAEIEYSNKEGAAYAVEHGMFDFKFAELR